MTFRTTSTHWEIIIAFMEKNKDFARGFLNGASGKDRTKKLWEELTTQLNSAGFGEKSIAKWQKTWTDFKHLLKKKAAGINMEIHRTGGGPPELEGLSDIENRILCILGPTFYKGVGRPENGCNFATSTKPNQNINEMECNEVRNTDDNEIQVASLTQKDLSTSSQQNTNFQITTSTRKETTQHTGFGIATSSQNNTSTQLTQAQSPILEEVTHKRQLPLPDHDYLKTPMKNPKRFKSKSEEPMEAMYRDTINELRDIKSCLQELTESNKGIQSALERIAMKM